MASLQSRDEAVQWILVAKRLELYKDVSQLIAQEIFTGFEYLDGPVVWKSGYYPPETLIFAHGQLISWLSTYDNEIETTATNIYGMFVHVRHIFNMNKHNHFYFGERWASDDEFKAITEVLCAIPLAEPWHVGLRGMQKYTLCTTYGDIYQLVSHMNSLYGMKLAVSSARSNKLRIWFEK